MSKSERRNLNSVLTGVVLVICAACATGCMSAMARGSGEPSAGTKVAAGAADVVTLPLQATALGGWWVVESAHEAKQRRYAARAAKQLAQFESLKKKLEQDPEIVFREGWHTSSNGMNIGVLQRCLTDGQAPFTDSMLRRMYAESSNVSVIDYVFRHPACSTNFLIESFPEALKRCESQECVRLASIVSNTNTPIEIIKPALDNSDVPLKIGAVRQRLGLPPLR